MTYPSKTDYEKATIDGFIRKITTTIRYSLTKANVMANAMSKEMSPMT